MWVIDILRRDRNKASSFYLEEYGMKYKFVYHGPVLYFDRLASGEWKAETIAETDKKALSNLSYQCKKKANLVPGSKITLDKRYLKKVEGLSYDV